jgi:hypothetical protein
MYMQMSRFRTGSKASLLGPSNSESYSGFSDAGTVNSTVVYASSSGRFLGAAPKGMPPTSTDNRVRTPLVGSAGKSSGWVIAGYSVDYALDWALVVVMGIVLAASEAGVPREG